MTAPTTEWRYVNRFQGAVFACTIDNVPRCAAWIEVAVLVDVEWLHWSDTRKAIATVSLESVADRHVPAVRNTRHHVYSSDVRAEPKRLRLFAIVPFDHIGHACVCVDAHRNGIAVRIVSCTAHRVYRRCEPDRLQRGVSFLIAYDDKDRHTLLAVLDALAETVDANDRVLCVDRASSESVSRTVSAACERHGFAHAAFGLNATQANRSKAQRFAARMASTTCLIHWDGSWVPNVRALRQFLDHHELRQRAATDRFAFACRGVGVLRSEATCAHFLQTSSPMNVCCAVAKLHRGFDGGHMVQVDTQRTVFTRIRFFDEAATESTLMALTVRALRAAEECTDEVASDPKLVDALTQVQILPLRITRDRLRAATI